MTCIVALRDSNGKVTLAGDSGAFTGWNVSDRPDGKVWRSGEMLFGTSGTSRGGAIMRYSFEPPAIPAGVPLIKYLNTTFVDALRKACKDAGYLKVESGVDGLGTTLLIGLRGRIYWMDNVFDISEVMLPYHAIGAGAEYAMGAIGMAMDQFRGHLEADMAVVSIEVARMHSSAVHGDVTTVSEYEIDEEPALLREGQEILMGEA